MVTKRCDRPRPGVTGEGLAWGTRIPACHPVPPGGVQPGVREYPIQRNRKTPVKLPAKMGFAALRALRACEGPRLHGASTVALLDMHENVVEDLGVGARERWMLAPLIDVDRRER
jgi:hypothetical protein